MNIETMKMNIESIDNHLQGMDNKNEILLLLLHKPSINDENNTKRHHKRDVAD
jgi:hypothetical protein